MSINLLWDLDGTLADSMPVIANCLNKTAVEYGRTPWSLEALRPMIGPELGLILAEVLNIEGAEAIADAKQSYRRYYREEMLSSPLFEGIEQALAHFQSIGAEQYVATAKYREYAQLIIAETPIARYFSGIYGSTEEGRYGDKRELLQHLLQEEHLQPAQTLMIGDTRYDMEGARANNLTAIGVLWGYSDAQSLREAGAHYLVETPTELADVVRQALTCGC